MTSRSALCWNSEGQRATFVLHPASPLLIFTYFFKSDTLCGCAERIEAQKLRQDLIQIVEEILRDMPQLCVSLALAGGSDCPITHREVNSALGLSNERFDSRWEEALNSVRSTLFS